MKAWSGRFTQPTAKSVEEFTASLHVDKRLWKADILGSICYSLVLLHAQVLNNDETKKITVALKKIFKKIASHQIEWNITHEDIHMHIEYELHQEIGELAGKLHTGRSRNDQVATDIRLYLREELLNILEKLFILQKALLEQAETHQSTILPAYTHLQRAQPVRLAHHLLAYISMFQRDSERLKNVWPSLNIMPLGAGAITGSGINIDRFFLAELLAFQKPTKNSIDAVSDRDFALEFLFCIAMLSQHLSRLCEELILFASHEFNYVHFDDSFCTGSSQMPQKKNPDVAELIRGKTGRVYGNLVNLLTMAKGLTLSYHKDLQEDKEALFDSIDTIKNCLHMASLMIKNCEFNTKQMKENSQDEFIYTTILANELVKKGLPFRQAHHVVGGIIQYALTNKCTIQSISIEKLKEISPLIDEKILQCFNIENSVEYSQVSGGTSLNSVNEQIKNINYEFKQSKKWLKTKKIILENLYAYYELNL
jgi:argininosuccinate lyase